MKAWADRYLVSRSGLYEDEMTDEEIKNLYTPQEECKDVPHRGLYATSVYADFMRDLDRAVQLLLGILYGDTPEPPAPLSDKTAKLQGRNEQIRTRYAIGETLVELAAAYNISLQRIHQIVHGKRK